MNVKLTKKAFIFFIFILNLLIAYISVGNAASNVNYYLSKPTGQYDVGFEDFHWINQNICPDFNFNGKNQDDFSANNTNFCHEIMVRIYYPTNAQNQPRAPYYKPIIKMHQKFLQEMPNLPQEQIEELKQLKSFTFEKAPIAQGKNFPVILFSPGFGCPAEFYENFITEVVSFGYIVVGINTSFINSLELPNGHIVNPARPTDRKEVESKFVPLQRQDLIYVVDQIHSLHHSSPLFRAMDLKRIGVFGHSIGARILADVAHANPGIFQAAVALDIGFDTTGASTKKFDIPFMHQISAGRKSSSTIPIVFELGNNGYLVGFSPNEQDHRYSSHMNFSDASTLQYMPALQALQDYRRQHSLDGFSLKLMSHDPTDQDCQHFDKFTYVLIKKENMWTLFFYQDHKKVTDIPTRLMDGLDRALANLPNKNPEQLTESEISNVKKIIMEEHKLNVEVAGTGNGWEITYAINDYLLRFFNHFLKYQEDSAFLKCTVISKNTYMKCGPGQV